MRNLHPGPIGVFDSGYGGLTILKEIKERLPEYDYLYLGDNARAPYGERSFDVVYDFTLQAVRLLFERGCNLVILACNTASAKALRTIQQNDLPAINPDKRVLGVIIPTVEAIGNFSKSDHVGVLATPGTVKSHSYLIESAKLFPNIVVTEKACPMWVPIVENGEAENPGADYFVNKYLSEILSSDPNIDTLLLGCTHYPILINKIRQFIPKDVKIVTQGKIVSESLKDYLLRHPEMEEVCSKSGNTEFLTSENPEKFNTLASLFLNEQIHASRVNL
ncbi:MAG: glutamate racemase [Muribaculaceae bacterium]|nr:glutamate racemase [Muribaculaceae bacterium]